MAAHAEKQRTEKRTRAHAVTPAATSAPNGNAQASAQPMMDLEFLRGLIEAVDHSGIDSLEIHRAGTKIRISKTPAPGPVVSSLPAAPMMPALPPMGSPQPHPHVHPAPEASPAEPVVESKSHLVDVKSPMVGTFYRAPAPEAPSYVEIGSHVTRGQTLCILEAMKLMNELDCEVDGIVREILVDNADPVEYGQVLFRIEPSGR